MTGLDFSKPISLYIHVPLCTRKCSYCAFYSLAERRWPIKPDEYAAKIIESIRALPPLRFSTVYLGGGNPGLLSDDAIVSIINESSRYGRAEEITLELNPEEVSEKRIEMLRNHIDRISIGVQSLNEKTLSFLGRNSTRDENINALKILRDSKINFNADLMTAIPGSSIDDTLRDIDELSSFSPSHISFYCLTFEENTPLYPMREMRDEEFEISSLLSGWKRLKELGYEHYEVSNFARDGKYSKHNINYWNLGQYIGVGPASESSIGWRDISSYHEVEDLCAWLDGKRGKVEKLSRIEGALEYIMVSLRSKWGVNKKELSERFLIDFDSTFKNALGKLDKNSYTDTDSSFSLTEKGWMILDSIILTLSLEF